MKINLLISEITFYSARQQSEEDHCFIGSIFESAVFKKKKKKVCEEFAVWKSSIFKKTPKNWSCSCAFYWIRTKLIVTVCVELFWSHIRINWGKFWFALMLLFKETAAKSGQMFWQIVRLKLYALKLFVCFKDYLFLFNQEPDGVNRKAADWVRKSENMKKTLVLLVFLVVSWDLLILTNFHKAVLCVLSGSLLYSGFWIQTIQFSC